MFSSKFLPFPSNPTLPFSPSPHTHLFNPTLLPQSPIPSPNIPSKSVRLLHPKPLLSSPSGDQSNPASAPASLPKNQSSETQETQEAQEAISEFLQQFGVSAADSDLISSNSPRYLAMLVDGVKELDELSLWDSWKSEGKESVAGDVGFKKKVFYMAKEKGDNGKVAFLESVGLSLSSAMNVARYLSAETLPCLIHRVKCMKEMLFCGSNDGGLIGKNARRMMMFLSITIDEEVQQTLSFFEKIAARRGGLETLGSNNASFQYLIESFPRLLLLSVESHMKPMVEFLENIGVPRERMINVILLFPPIIFCNIEVIKRRVLAFKEVAAMDKDVGKVLVKYPWILSTSIQDNYKVVLSFFNLEKVPTVSVHRAIKSWPHLLGCSTSKLKLMVEQFEELGVRNKKLGLVIAKSPQLLLRKPRELLQVISYLEHLGLDKETIGRIIGRCPEIFATSIEKTLKRKIEFLTGIGVLRAHLPRVIKKYPEVLVSDVDRTLLPRMTYLMTLGLTGKDIAFMVRRFSPLLGYSIEEVLRPKVEFLVNTMERPITDVVDYPRYFSYSLEKKIKPRFWVLRGRNVECSLMDMLGKNDEEFAVEYLEAGSMHIPPSPAHQ
ncbi:hypothetical protein F2P56_016165 [Juglans regia]|uniref:Transcription termination factor MTERF2, chloroplastic n=2 Tax=Juglans regia TaxID=51240 RepID=A0A2I4H279_JUGRE|nr:transcription termination factor MTERF2, chloroplastic [Juglans regia]KAF5466218.1 hypothetical protein F2P56_016165 [Juglans regia]